MNVKFNFLYGFRKPNFLNPIKKTKQFYILVIYIIYSTSNNRTSCHTKSKIYLLCYCIPGTGTYNNFFW